ncbi:exosortase-dependent surface protein XDP1 [Chitinimonas sp. BJB300]|uniref:exosortase-dependent surface protein XDP1 n=1 Tax=Chitinimonas sp. BJB300 TaxID=1559339 RepID=UPI000C0E7F13|nr:exosortase-dependent surface protein XDP1 [Chitinimonas sp. BJB300]PHV13188.1 hypothetical protein CSQ89_01970 [Chitinimonas sp. BJB300]TSJ87170.1 PEP-CTERM sorting domain-containing protein [Chitinimonas sp. BJB300]
MFFGLYFAYIWQDNRLTEGLIVRKQLKLLCATALLSAPAFASTTWTLGSTPTPGMTVSAYANTGGTNNSANAANNGALQTIQSATKVWYSGGLGITNADTCTSGSYCDVNEGVNPEHAIDNQQRYDMVLLSFTSAVMLTGVKLGWFSNDSDITVMAYTGAGIPTLVGKKYTELAGWSSIGNYSDVGSTTAAAINAGNLVSSYWLIGAYNPLANPTGGSVTGASNSYDYIKIASVTSDIPKITKVAEPGSLALVGLALMGVVGARRRKQAK